MPKALRPSTIATTEAAIGDEAEVVRRQHPRQDDDRGEVEQPLDPAMPIEPAGTRGDPPRACRSPALPLPVTSVEASNASTVRSATRFSA